jgi:hypothetical protein
VRSLFGLAVEELRRRCQQGKQTQFAIFEWHDIEAPSSGRRPSYEELAREHELPVTQVTNYLAWARREFRKIVLDKLRELTASDEEFCAEAREILGGEPPAAAARRQR